ncbi:MAG: VWA domain-containing protein [Acidobacteriota bacterium]
MSSRIQDNHTLFPFSAIVGQDAMKLGLILNAVDPRIGGILITGTRGTAKSTTVRSLASLLPSIEVLPMEPPPETPGQRILTPFVELPLGATEDRVLGTLDVEKVLQQGERHFEPGLLARAHRGILYIDEVNLLPDPLVDVILDVAAMGVNRVERDGVTFEHEAGFMLVGTMNPEEGELRPQLLDRFGLCAQVAGHFDVETRKEIVRRRLAFETAPAQFLEDWCDAEKQLSMRIEQARYRLKDVEVSEALLTRLAQLTFESSVDGARADLVLYRACRAMAAFQERTAATDEDLEAVAELALAHRRRTGGKPAEGPGAKSPPVSGPPGGVRSAPVPRDSAQAAQGERQPQNPQAQRPPTIEPIGSAYRLKLGLPQPGKCIRKANRGTRARRGSTSARLGMPRSQPPSRADHSAALDLPATVRAAALNRIVTSTRPLSLLPLRSSDLRRKCRVMPPPFLVVLVVDASGSMGALARMRAAKGAACSLLEDSHRQRAWVSLVVFREARAELLLRPTRSAFLAYRLLQQLPAGGQTPLAAGLDCALALVTLQKRKEPSVQPILALITDGRATLPAPAPLAAALAVAKRIRAAGIRSLCLDTENSTVRLRQCDAVARTLGAEYQHVGRLPSRDWGPLIREWVHLEFRNHFESRLEGGH